MLAADKLEQAGIPYELEARDISEYKVSLMQDNFDRCQLENARAVAWDALQTDERLVEQVDVVIADVPCSGLGVIGRKRDIKYKMNQQAIDEIVKLQEKILKVAASYVKKGGRLLFSTCTINQAENEKHAAWIRDTLEMTPVSLNLTLPETVHTQTTQKGYLQLMPGVWDTDGFFISVFEKQE